MSHELTDLARRALDISAVTYFEIAPHVDRIDVGTLAVPKRIPGVSSVTITIDLTVVDYEAGRRLFPEAFDRLDRMIDELKK